MGCDIHAYVEYSDDDGKYWRALTDNAGSRNYLLFGVLAGVRYDDAKLFEPKGMPDGAVSHVTESAYWVRVAPDDKPQYAEWDGWTSKETAERWVIKGYSRAEYREGALSRVSNPDWHSHSWLTAEELSRALDKYRSIVGSQWPSEAGKAPTLWTMILGAMQAAEANGAKTRIVFWFDN